MTIATTNSRNVHAGNGSTQTFAFDWDADSASEVQVTYFGPTYATAGEVQTITTDYTVDSFGPTGGQITTVATLTSDDTVEIARTIAQTQEVDLVQNDPFEAEVMEGALDKLTKLVQTTYSLAETGIRVTGAADEPPNYTMPPPEDGKFPVGNVSGGWDNKEIGDLSATSITVPVAVAEGGTGAITAALARTNLGLGSAAVLDTGTGAGELPTNGDLGTAAQEDVGTGANEIPQLNASSQLPAVSGRNLTEVRGFVLLSEQTVAAQASTVDTYDFTSLDTYDNYMIELDRVAVDTNAAEIVIEAYSGATLYGSGGTGSLFAWQSLYNQPGFARNFGSDADDAFEVSPRDWLGDHDSGNEFTFLSGTIVVRNGSTDFPSGTDQRKYPVFIGRDMWGLENAGGVARIYRDYGCTAVLKAAVVLDGFRVRVDHSVAAYFDGGIIRIWGYNGPAIL